MRAPVAPGEPLSTPTGRGGFTVARYTTEGLGLLRGAKAGVDPRASGPPTRTSLAVIPEPRAEDHHR